MNEVGFLGARRLREILARHEVRPRKSLGQNFVIDPNTIRKVVEVAQVSDADVVLEVGAGAGSLTVGLANRAARVIAVEKDPRLLPVLEETVGVLDNVEVVHADAETMGLAATGANKLVANLPYNIAAILVLLVLEKAPNITRLIVMTQKEVGERLAAPPGSKTYGLTSVRAAFYGEVKVATNVSRTAFWPVPNVDSVVVSIERHDQLPAVMRDDFYAVTAAAFSQRRKMLRKTLAPVFGSADRAETVLRSCGIDPTFRAEQVGVDGYVRLAKEMS